MPVKYKNKFPGTPPKEAIEWFKKKGLKIGFNWQEVWQTEHRTAFTVARIMELDILLDMRNEVQKALEEGTTFQQFRKDVMPILEKSGWSSERPGVSQKSRIKTIYDTNMRMSRATGQRQRVERTKKLLPYLIYELGPSKVHRDEHLGWAGTILPVDDPWWQEHYPPSDFGCKCRVRQIMKEEAEKRGISEEAPPNYDVPWENKVTGETGVAPVGVNPAFAYNKLDERSKSLDKLYIDREKKWKEG